MVLSHKLGLGFLLSGVLSDFRIRVNCTRIHNPGRRLKCNVVIFKEDTMQVLTRVAILWPYPFMTTGCSDIANFYGIKTKFDNVFHCRPARGPSSIWDICDNFILDQHIIKTNIYSYTFIGLSIRVFLMQLLNFI